jgi:hypothetical protein
VVVIPAKAGIHSAIIFFWIPAFAGMTDEDAIKNLLITALVGGVMIEFRIVYFEDLI